ncbi:hypothetical protein fugu_010861 [Takifugu bimaculatus]|uniref:EGF-like domain-containing protein n=1 Tax=Takifugu bimaculatus TaxID=433685 RepID=A0A4Z2CBC3_9TELE|nr:hypothetical protein fugu_010861 [Takifugu bimaculatus]
MACARRRPSPLILVLLLAGGCCGLGIRINPSPFQLALDTPAPAEPTPTRASHHLDLCEGQPCLNGGVCLALPGASSRGDTFEYTCSCSQGFAGRNCEFITDPCTSSPCLHGNCSRSYREDDVEPSYICECAEGYEGERCDQTFCGAYRPLPYRPGDPVHVLHLYHHNISTSQPAAMATQTRAEVAGGTVGGNRGWSPNELDPLSPYKGGNGEEN